MNIAILDQSCKGWSAGASFTRMLLASLSLAKDQAPGRLVFFSSGAGVQAGEGIETVEVPPDATGDDWQRLFADHEIAVALPVRDHRVFDIPGPKVGWVPDFQHVRLPELFTKENRIERDELLSAVAGRSDLVLVSSESARADFVEFSPELAGKARVGRFSSMLWQDGFRELTDVRRKYHLPEKFLLVANQFWKHKDHAVLPDAVATARAAGADVCVVCTGLTCDYRDPENRIFSEFLRRCSELGIRDAIVILGQVPYDDLVSLMRTACAILQPSRFEGWSTSIEDCKALGRPLICSDIPVHREQAGEGAIFFELSNSDSLGRVLADQLPDLTPGPDLERERTALASASDRARAYGAILVQIAQEAVMHHQQEPGGGESPRPAPEKSVPLVRQQAAYIEELEVACAERLAAMQALQIEVERLREELRLHVRSPWKSLLKRPKILP